MALTKIGTDGFKDDAVTTDKLANDINTERTANTAKSTNATHTGEVTGSGALTITDDTVDEANLKISNAGSNGQFLQKQSGNTGGLTWADATSTTINNNADNRLITGSGTANTLEGEANLTYNGTRLDVKTGDLQVIGAEGGDAQLRLTADEGDDGEDYWRLESKASDNNFNLATYASGSWVDKISVRSDGEVHIGTIESGNDRGAAAIKAVNDHAGSPINVYFQEASGGEGYGIGIDSDGDLNFHNSGSTTPTLEVKDDNNVAVTNGNLVIGTAGKGIDFSAQTGTGSGAGSSTEAELLNHYEEGKLNATAISSGLTFTTAGGSNKNLHYVRIGNWVTVSGYLEVSSFTSDGTNIQIQMPFTSASNSDGYYTRGVGATMAASINLPSTAYLTAYVGGGENYMRLYYTQNDSNYHQMVNSDLTSSSGIYFSLSYGI